MTSSAQKTSGREISKSAALKFVVLIGVLSFFADFTYEGSRSILGPFLATLQASAAVVAIVTGFVVLIVLTLVTALFAPLVFLGGFSSALVGAALWGLGIGVHESLIPAAVAPMVPVQRRASAYGLFTAGYGLFWFLGSVAIGILYGVSVTAAVTFCVAAELAAVPIFVLVRRKYR
jgi:MFS family permease